MSTVTRTTVWVDNQVLTASALNGEFNNLLNALALTDSDIASGAGIQASKILNTAATLSDTQTLTNKTLTSPIINVGSDAQGDIYYRNGAGLFTRLAPGTSGQVLKTQGASANPQWAVGNNPGFAQGVTGNPTTTSLTYVDMTDLSVTLTTTGGNLFVWLCSIVYENSSNNIHIAIALDGGVEQGEMVQFPASTNNDFNMSTFWRFTGVSAGSHTIKGRWKVDGGTGTLISANRQLLVIEM